MKKRLLALLLAIVIIVGLIAMGIPASAAESQPKTYEVGYAKVDVNPWILYPVDENGNTYITDENGSRVYDGVPDNMTDESGKAIGIDYNADWSTEDIEDYVTEVSVSDGNGGTKTVGIIKSRLSGAGTAKSNYAAGVLDDNGDGEIGLGDGLQITATTVTDTAGKTVVFITIDCIGGNNTLYKDHLRTSLVTEINNAGGSIDANSIYLSGSHTHNAPDMTDLATASSGTPLNAYWGYYIAQVKKAALAAFNSRTPATMSKGAIKASDVIGCEMNYVRHYQTSIVENGENLIGGSNFGPNTAKRTTHISEADDMMYLLRFTPTNGGKSTVLVNWRAHGTFIGGTQSKNYSSDYIGPLRTYLEAENYNVAFLQGAAGNVVPEKLGSADSPWMSQNKYAYTYPGASGAIQDLKDANQYGFLLSKVALACLDQEEMQVNLNTGNIQYNFIYYKDTSPVYSCELQKDSLGLQAAATAWVEAGKPNADETWPYRYEYTDGTYILNSYHHASSVYSRIGNADTQNISIGAIMLGSQVAMVTSSYELFDRYSATDTIENLTDGNSSDDDNDWLNLEDERYGTPFVLAYTNGHHSYLPNSLAYTYNENSDTYGAGSYEANTSPFAQGTGEKLIVQFKKMLTELAGNTTDDATGPVVSGSSYYDTLAEAVEDVGENALLKLVDNVGLDGNLVIDKDLYLDLNGKTITFGQYKINVEGDYKLYCMDSQTADFTVEDGNGYAKIPANSVVGNVVGVPEGTNRIEEGLQYMKVVENNQISFHCVKLDTYAITLQAKDGNSEDPGVYYTSDFAGDEVVQSKVESYGVALSLVEAPSASNIDTLCQKSTYTGLNSGSSTGTLLYNILNPNNAELVNRVNANTNVFGKAYIKLKDDAGYLFGNLADYSLKDVVESINNSWDRYETTQKDNVVNMLFNYSSIVKSWDISNIRTHKTDDNSLNILVIGNSHGLDSTRMLYEVFKAENYQGDLVIANLYKGGCTMSEHADFLTNNKARYQYHKVSTESEGKWTCQTGATGLTALQDEQWDIVILQQANQDSGIATEFKENQLNAVMNYVKANQISTPEFAWNMLWANPDDYDQFLEYTVTDGVYDYAFSIGNMSGKNAADEVKIAEVEKFRTNLEKHFATDGVYQQENMYAAITANVNSYSDYIAAENLKNGYEGAVKVNPAGTAIQKAQQLLLDNEIVEDEETAQLRVFRDYTHLSHYGRLITAYTLYCTLTDKTSITDENGNIIREIPYHLNVNEDGHISTYNWSNSYPKLENNKYTFTAQDIEVLTEAVNWALTNPYTVEN